MMIPTTRDDSPEVDAGGSVVGEEVGGEEDVEEDVEEVVGEKDVEVVVGEDVVGGDVRAQLEQLHSVAPAT